MHTLEQIAERVRRAFDIQMAARDRALSDARALTRHCALAIRAAHREEPEVMQEHLGEAARLADSLRQALQAHPDLYYAGYTQDALKEYVEASVTCALIYHRDLPSPDDLNVPHATYLNGLAEAVGELRRRCLDILRHGYSEEAERLLSLMDEIFAVLVTMDYPEALTNGLRRQTDLARGIIERTRGDITFSLRGEHLERALAGMVHQVNGTDDAAGSHPPSLRKPLED